MFEVVTGILIVTGAGILIALTHPEGAIILKPLVWFVKWFLKTFLNIDRPLVGMESLIGKNAIVSEVKLKNKTLNYKAVINNEIWNLTCENELSPGDKVKITGFDGLVLIVEKLPNNSLQATPKSGSPEV